MELLLGSKSRFTLYLTLFILKLEDIYDHKYIPSEIQNVFSPPFRELTI
jgi:hypothetical protein